MLLGSCATACCPCTSCQSSGEFKSTMHSTLNTEFCDCCNEATMSRDQGVPSRGRGVDGRQCSEVQVEQSKGSLALISPTRPARVPNHRVTLLHRLANVTGVALVERVRYREMIETGENYPQQIDTCTILARTHLHSVPPVPRAPVQSMLTHPSSPSSPHSHSHSRCSNVLSYSASVTSTPAADSASPAGSRTHFPQGRRAQPPSPVPALAGSARTD